VVGGWRKFHNKELHDFSTRYQMVQVKEDDVGRVWTMHGEKRIASRILVRKLEGRMALRRPGCNWGDNSTMNVREIG
jgi:hypothetical protein